MSEYTTAAVTIDSEAFTSLKSDFNQVLAHAISSMLEKSVDESEIKVAMKISLTKSFAPDREQLQYPAEREIIIPSFEYKVTTSIKLKTEKSGVVGSTDYEMIWDNEENKYIMKKIDSNQISLFDSPLDIEQMDEEGEDGEDDENDA